MTRVVIIGGGPGGYESALVAAQLGATVTVIDRNDKNAFVLPTGNIFVFSGMLDMCTNDDQVSKNIVI